MTKIIGRIEERQELAEAFNSSKAEFLVLYGRRQVGKTFLIEQFFTEKTGVFFHVTGVQDGLLTEQLGEFSKATGKNFIMVQALLLLFPGCEELTKAIDGLTKSKKLYYLLMSYHGWQLSDLESCKH